ncbi:MAG: nucleotidyltransferase domain-containing protein [Deltaproteobacteria bacterium]|nr:nucleotidyltransferase domain-containing protein [Deltaproteobacteria bacterium]
MIHGLSPDDQKLIESVLREYKDVHEAVVFGSRAMGNQKIGSDIDIALKGNISGTTLRLIIDRLENEIPLPYKFDIIIYNQINSQPLKEHIDIHGRTFYLVPIK